MVAISNSNSNVNNNNNNNNDNNNNININHDSANFAQMGMVNMMSRRKKSRNIRQFKKHGAHRRLLGVACQLEDRRTKLNNPANWGLKILK